MRQAFATGFAAFLLSDPALSSYLPMPILLFCLKLPTPLSSCSSMPALLSCPGLLTPLLSCFSMPVLPSCPFVPILLSLLVPVLASRSVLGLALTQLTSSALKIFKQTLLEEFLDHQSTSPSPLKPLCLFPIFGLLPKKNNCKQLFNMAFINSRLFATNHAAKEIDLNFGEYGCPASVKLNRSWQLELLDCKPVCIIEAIFLAATLFWGLLFALCLRYIMKLVSKLGLRTENITNKFVKDKIESVWANRTICQLNQLFWNNPKWWTGTAIIYAQSSAKARRK